jgi:DNA polymerase IV
MNAFFASVEQAANPALRGKPIVVCGGIKKMSVVAAASYEAKKLGIKTAMSTWDAKKICPDVIIIVGDMPKYVSTSKAITKQMRTYTDLVEVFSIDEAWMDVTDAKKRFEARDQRSGEIVIAQQLKGWIRQKFGLTCNIGIGPNKLMAKFAGELKKPDGLIVLRPEDIPDKIMEVPVRTLCGVGRKLEEYLAEMGVKTYGELNRCPREKLVKRFGVAYGEHLWCMGQGKDDSPVRPYWYEEDAKSMGHSYHMPHLTKDINEAKGYILRLAEQVGRRLRKDNYQGNIIHVTLGFGNFEFWGKRKKLGDFIDDGFDVYREAERIIDSELKTNEALRFALLPRSEHKGIRFVGVTISGLRHNLDQISIFDEVENKKKVLQAVDKINDRFGEFTVERAAIMNTVLQKKTGMVASGLYKRF